MSGIFLKAHISLTSQLEQCHSDCYGWALHCCNRDAEKASEVLQTAYLKILQKPHMFRGRSTFKTWVFTVIKNTAVDAAREQRKSEKRVVGGLQFTNAAYESDSESRLDEKNQQAFFLDALHRLSDRQRQIMQLVFYHDLSINQAAEVLNISAGSARQHYHRAKKALAEWFQNKGIERFK